jgi:hypothetical protein
LGSDGQFWLTNGSSATIASTSIQNLVYTLTQNAKLANQFQKFNAIYNDRFQYYICDFGNNTQLAYKWDTGAWWLFQGWPSGAYVPAIAKNGLPTIYVLSGRTDILGAFEIGLQQTDDNGSPIEAYYTSPYLHGGKPERQKLFDTFSMFTLNVGIQYKVTAFAMPRADGVVQTSKPLILNDPAFGATPTSSNAAIWDVSLWDVGVWGGGFPSLAQPYSMAPMRGRRAIASTGSKWMPANEPGRLMSGAVQFKIEWSGGVPDFRMLGFNVAMQFRSPGQVGNLPFSTEGNQTSGGPNPFTNQGV